MTPTCPYFGQCEFILIYISKVEPHWDDFVTHYCQGSFQELCKRKSWFNEHGTPPPVDLMPSGNRVPEIIEELRPEQSSST